MFSNNIVKTRKIKEIICKCRFLNIISSLFFILCNLTAQDVKIVAVTKKIITEFSILP